MRTEVSTSKSTTTTRIETRSSVTTISPNKATELLSTVGPNRKVSMHHVRALAGAMERGEWIPEVSEIVIDKNGELIDGQHRLHAIILHGKPVRMRVVTGVNPDFKYVIDTGKVRRFHHILQMNEEKNATTLASATRLLWLYSNGSSENPLSTEGALKATNPQLLGMLGANPGLRVSTDFGRQFQSKLGGIYPVSLVAFFHYLFSHIDQDGANWFFERLADGTGLNPGDAVYKLRQTMIQASKRDHGARMSRTMQMALTIKAWNAQMAGESISTLRWRTIGPGREKFPVIGGLDRATLASGVN